MDTKYSIWLEFPGYQATVAELAAEAGNPVFVPHITVVGALTRPLPEITAVVRPMAALVDPVAAEFTQFGSKAEEWRFFCLVSRKTRPLGNLFKGLHLAFPEAAAEHFRSWPHVSLLYGTPAARQLWPDPVNQLEPRFGERLFGRRPSSRLAIWQTGGPVTAWQREKLFELRSP